MELVDVRDLHILFEDAPHVLKMVYVWRHAWPFQSRYPQFLYQGTGWRCVWGHYHFGMLSCNPVSEGRVLWSSSVFSQYMLAFMIPSMNCSLPNHKNPTTMLDCRKDTLVLCSSPGCCYTHLTPSEPDKCILVSSDHRKWF
ncbi:hypothetical protein AMECASPLE_011864 [Ameca splendens]|uniref:Uncharacterized protein n=1 Tax=Ameca splendens TaxID=208324 RepID=A0ABV0ZKL9_9TELE